jgi:hypothetical protein
LICCIVAVVADPDIAFRYVDRYPLRLL